MSGIDEVPRQQPGAAADLDHLPAAHRFQQSQDSGCDRVGVRTEPLVMDPREVPAVVRIRQDVTPLRSRITIVRAALSQTV